MKTVIWKPDGRQELKLDNRRLFVESIDMTGTAGIHTVEALAFSDGQETIAHQLGAKTIPCSFALSDRTGDRWLRENLPLFFDPSKEGTLTVLSGTERYTIRCYPQNVPVFKRDSVPYVWRFDVDFVADFPYWSRGRRTEQLTAAVTTVVSDSPFDTPITISFPANNPTPFNINDYGFTLKSCTVPLIVDTRDFSVKDAQGNDKNNFIDALAPLNRMRIRYGENTIFCPEYSGVEMSFDILSMGEI